MLFRARLFPPRVVLLSRRCLAFSSRGHHSPPLHPAFRYSPEVQEALSTGKPLVALESTIISHGMPFPDNVETAREVEGIIRAAGVVPATIAILKGRVHIGLTDEEILHIGKVGRACTKTSRRDLALVAAERRDGATTVSATMILAHKAGIPIFVTGGIGGVHRGGEESLDISADLTELGRTPVAIVCAGIKSILDIGRTLEYLETQGVSVVTLGNKEFPAFFTPRSGHASPWTCATVEEGAGIIHANGELGIGSGMVFAIPIPEEASADGTIVQSAIDQALQEARDTSISGSATTPFLLARIAEMTQGASLRANIALIKNNARVGADLAKAYYRMGSASKISGETVLKPGSPMIIGGIGVDISARFDEDEENMVGSSHPGRVWQCLGGVGGNVTRSATRLGARPILVAPIGEDAFGEFVVSQLRMEGVRVDGIERVATGRTPVFCALLRATGSMVTAVADMQLVERMDKSRVEAWIRKERPRVVCFDGNITPGLMSHILRTTLELSIPTIFEPTSVAKCGRVLEEKDMIVAGGLTWVAPNDLEVEIMAKTMESWEETLGDLSDSPIDIDQESLEALKKNGMTGIVRASQILTQYIPRLMIKMGAAGVMLVMRGSSVPGAIQDDTLTTPVFRHYPIHESDRPEEIISVTGAGDSMVGALVAGLEREWDGMEEGSALGRIIEVGQRAAHLTIRSDQSVPDGLSVDLWGE